MASVDSSTRNAVEKVTLESIEGTSAMGFVPGQLTDHRSGALHARRDPAVANRTT